MWFKREIVVPKHSEDQPTVKNELTKKEDKVKEYLSIFKQRKVDTLAMYKEAFNIDETQWKVNRLIRDEQEYIDCRNLVARHFDKLKEIFIVLAARSAFPVVDNFTIQMFS